MSPLLGGLADSPLTGRGQYNSTLLRKISPLSGQHGMHFSITVMTGHWEIRGMTKNVC
jgi:hypothetical protein